MGVSSAHVLEDETVRVMEDEPRWIQELVRGGGDDDSGGWESEPVVSLEGELVSDLGGVVLPLDSEEKWWVGECQALRQRQ